MQKLAILYSFFINSTQEYTYNTQWFKIHDVTVWHSTNKQRNMINDRLQYNTVLYSNTDMDAILQETSFTVHLPTCARMLFLSVVVAPHYSGQVFGTWYLVLGTCASISVIHSSFAASGPYLTDTDLDMLLGVIPLLQK